MNLFFFIAAAIIFFLGGISSPVIPNPIIWGLFCVALGLACGDWRPWARPPR